MSRVVHDTATDGVHALSGELGSVAILGGVDAATAIWRTGGSAGTVIAALGVATLVFQSHAFHQPVHYENLHVTVTGTTPDVLTEIV